MGNGRPLLTSGNHYLSLNLSAVKPATPWRFPACYLADRPIEYPLGTEKSVAVLNWRAIPYGPQFNPNDGSLREIVSSGTVLWDHTADV